MPAVLTANRYSILTLVMGAAVYACSSAPMCPQSNQPSIPSAAPQSTRLEWYRGNTHTHTLNSDGDATPVAVASWYREHGYQFLVITDHEYLTEVRSLNETVGGKDKFIVIPGEEVTQEITDEHHPDGYREIHINAINPKQVVHAMGAPFHDGLGRMAPSGTTVASALAHNIGEIKAAAGIAQVDHPNFRWSIRATDLTNLPDGTLFEIWNGGHAPINNLGGVDEAGNRAPSAEQLWDILLSQGKHIWAVADDDSHDYHNLEDINSMRPGLAWIVVRADQLTAQAITDSIAKGDFYASNGVVLDDITASDRQLTIRIDPSGSAPILPGWKSDSRFATCFIGKGGRVLAEVGGLTARYVVRGDEGYVRARITDSNGRQAWTQPVFVVGNKSH